MENQNSSYSVQIGKTTFIVCVKQSETAKKPIEKMFKDMCRHEIIPGAIAPDRLNGKGLPPHHPDACGLRTRIPGRTVLRATMARSPKAASFKRTAGKAVPLTA